jgi:DNA replication protein DnaC
MNDSESLKKVIDKYKDVKYLIIDDLGASNNSEWQKEVLLDLIDHRYEFRKPTLITTNLNFEKMGEKLDDRIATRIYDRRNKFIEDWKSNYRKK